MKFLLDTHIFLWLLSEPDKLSPLAKKILEDKSNILFLSAASGWEISIKHQLQKLNLPQKPDLYLPEQMLFCDIQSLPITITHALNVYNLPQIHKDPFDRMLVSQAKTEKLPLITDDFWIKKYNIETIW